MSDSLPDHLKNPIIIIGAPRSGTSFLSRLLSEHSTLAMSIEPRLVWKWGNDGLSDLLSLIHARPEVIDYIRETFEKFVIENGRTRFAEKTPSNALRMAFVNEVFPDAKFVHIIRHGKDSALSAPPPSPAREAPGNQSWKSNFLAIKCLTTTEKFLSVPFHRNPDSQNQSTSIRPSLNLVMPPATLAFDKPCVDDSD